MALESEAGANGTQAAPDAESWLQVDANGRSSCPMWARPLCAHPLWERLQPRGPRQRPVARWSSAKEQRTACASRLKPLPQEACANRGRRYRRTESGVALESEAGANGTQAAPGAESWLQVDANGRSSCTACGHTRCAPIHCGSGFSREGRASGRWLRWSPAKEQRTACASRLKPLPQEACANRGRRYRRAESGVALESEAGANGTQAAPDAESWLQVDANGRSSCTACGHTRCARIHCGSGFSREGRASGRLAGRPPKSSALRARRG